MPPDAKKFLFDIQRAYTRLAKFTVGRTASDYDADELYPDVAERITEYRRIISFRNVLIHGYDAITSAVVWEILQQKLPILRAEVESMLNEPEQAE